MALDTIDKIVTAYFAPITKRAFTYKNKLYPAKILRVSPLLMRGFTCPANCGGCCIKVSLDYLPEETARPNNVVERTIEFDGRQVAIWSDQQTDNPNKHCQYLDDIGRCKIYELRPFVCDFELIRFLQSAEKSNLIQKLHGRGWRFERVDGGKGGLCKMTPPSRETVDEVIRKLSRLEEWTDHFGVETWIGEIIQWMLSEPTGPLILDQSYERGFLQPLVEG